MRRGGGRRGRRREEGRGGRRGEGMVGGCIARIMNYGNRYFEELLVRQVTLYM